VQEHGDRGCVSVDIVHPQVQLPLVALKRRLNGELDKLQEVGPHPTETLVEYQEGFVRESVHNCREGRRGLESYPMLLVTEKSNEERYERYRCGSLREGCDEMGNLNQADLDLLVVQPAIERNRI